MASLTKRLALALLLAPAATGCLGQKALKPLKNALKERNYTEARKQADALLADSLWRDNIEVCEMGIRAEKGLNDIENTKAYLKKSYDTLSFYSTTRNIIEGCAHIARVLRREGKANAKNSAYRRACATVHQYCPNLNSGARYLYRRGKYAEALPYLRLCLDLPADSLGRDAGISGFFPPHVTRSNAALHLTAAYRCGQYAEAPRYLATAVEEKKTRPLVIECAALSYEALGDTARYREWLQRGWESYPTTAPFFTRLTHYYIERGDFAATLRLAENQLAADSGSTQAMEARTLALFHLNRLDECAESGKALAAADSTIANAYYYTGAAYAGKAMQVVMPDNINSRSYRTAVKQRKQLYAEALPYLERYRQLAPDERKRWAPLLYKTYFALNKSAKFAEIEKILEE
jgi:tetratricopeptide (TPR) repeat protein